MQQHIWQWGSERILVIPGPFTKKIFSFGENGGYLRKRYSISQAICNISYLCYPIFYSLTTVALIIFLCLKNMGNLNNQQCIIKNIIPIIYMFSTSDYVFTGPSQLLYIYIYISYYRIVRCSESSCTRNIMDP